MKMFIKNKDIEDTQFISVVLIILGILFFGFSPFIGFSNPYGMSTAIAFGFGCSGTAFGIWHVLIKADAFLPDEEEEKKGSNVHPEGMSFNQVRDKHWKNIIPVIIIALLLVPSAQAANIYRDPSVINISFSVTRDDPTDMSEALVRLINNELEIIDNVGFESPFILDYSPREKILEPSITNNFTILFFVENVTQNETIYTDINITGEIDGESQIISTISLIMDIRANYEPLREYLYRKCFMEEGEEYCTLMNISELQNVTILNITEENVSVSVLLPVNTMKDYLSKYDQSLKDTTDELKTIADDVRQTSNHTRYLLESENLEYRNALMLETFMKQKKNPLWFELSPQNVLINITNLNADQFSAAMGVLFAENRVIQEFKDEWRTTPLEGGGVMTMPVKKTYVASTDRLEEERNTSGAANMVISSTAVIIIVLVIVGIYEFRIKKNPDW